MLSLENVSKVLNGKRIIDGVSLKFSPNEIVALVGPNGAGKTTLLNLIAKLINLTEGSISINSNKKAIAYMQDSSLLYNNLTGFQHLDFVANVNGFELSDINDVISELNMHSYIHKKVKSYSLGMKQHLMLGVALLTDSEILLLDEPLNGLDPDAIMRVRNIMLNRKNKGFSILFSSHNLSEVERISDRVIFIKQGSIVSIIDNKNLQDKVTVEVVFNEQVTENLIALLNANEYEVEEACGDRLYINFNNKNISSFFKLLHANDITNEVRKINEQKHFSMDKIYNEFYGEENV